MENRKIDNLDAKFAKRKDKKILVYAMVGFEPLNSWPHGDTHFWLNRQHTRSKNTRNMRIISRAKLLGFEGILRFWMYDQQEFISFARANLHYLLLAWNVRETDLIFLVFFDFGVVFTCRNQANKICFNNDCKTYETLTFELLY